MTRWMLLGILLMLHGAALAGNARYPFDNPQEEARFTGLLRELRCLVCQNQDLAESAASLADDLRGEVYRMMQEGKRNPEIVSWMTDRYGDFIRFKPAFNPLTALLWAAPALFLGTGVLVLYRQVRRASHDSA